MLNSTPAIRWVRECYPNASTTCLVGVLGEPMLRGNPDVDRVWVHFASRRGTVRRLRAEQFDIAVALQTSSWCHLLAVASGAKYRLGRDQKQFRLLLTHVDGTKYPKGEVHELERNLNLVRPICEGNPSRQVVLRLAPEELGRAANHLAQHGVGSRQPWLLLHPGGSSEDKRWPAESFAEVARRLSERSVSTVIVHGPHEAALARAVAQSVQVPVIATPSLRQLAALIGQAPLFLCNDSGPMHIASALGIPLVAIFGPTDHVRWAPQNGMIVRQDMDCWPCSAHQCKIGHACVKQLSVEDVWEKVWWILQRNQPHTG